MSEINKYVAASKAGTAPVRSETCYTYGVKFFPRASSQVTIFNFPSDKFLKVLYSEALQGSVGGPNAAARTNLGSCRLGNCTVGMLPLGKNCFVVYRKLNCRVFL